MHSRTQTSRMTFRRPFHLSGDTEPHPPGDYDLLVEEELIDGLSFDAWHRTGMWLTVRGRGALAARVELRPLTDHDLAQIRAEGDATEPAALPDAALTSEPCPS